MYELSKIVNRIIISNEIVAIVISQVLIMFLNIIEAKYYYSVTEHDVSGSERRQPIKMVQENVRHNPQTEGKKR